VGSHIFGSSFDNVPKIQSLTHALMNCRLGLRHVTYATFTTYNITRSLLLHCLQLTINTAGGIASHAADNSFILGEAVEYQSSIVFLASRTLKLSVPPAGRVSQ
jgi:hypothetical protein